MEIPVPTDGISDVSPPRPVTCAPAPAVDPSSALDPTLAACTPTAVSATATSVATAVDPALDPALAQEQGQSTATPPPAVTALDAPAKAPPTAATKAPATDVPAATATGVATAPATVPSKAPATAVTTAPIPASTTPKGHLIGDQSEPKTLELQGTRPEAFSASACYAGAKEIYSALAGLPVLGWIAPRVESVAETVLSLTPLPFQHLPDEQVNQKRVAVVDAMICEALVHADVFLGTAKTETFKVYTSATATASDAVDHVTTTVGIAVSQADVTARKTIKCLERTAYATVSGCKSAVGSTADCITRVCNGGLSMTKDSMGNIAMWMYNSATSIARSCVNGSMAVPCTIIHTVNRAKDNTVNRATWMFNWATSMAMSFFNASMAFPARVVQTFMG